MLAYIGPGGGYVTPLTLGVAALALLGVVWLVTRRRGRPVPRRNIRHCRRSEPGCVPKPQ